MGHLCVCVHIHVCAGTIRGGLAVDTVDQCIVRVEPLGSHCCGSPLLLWSLSVSAHTEHFLES